jgi:hypothetical protein
MATITVPSGAPSLELGTNQPYRHITHHPPSRARRLAGYAGTGLRLAGKGLYHTGRAAYYVGKNTLKAAAYGYAALHAAQWAAERLRQAGETPEEARRREFSAMVDRHYGGWHN